MAAINTATSGLASATSTWTGGVVPGTTFAGTRTTTGAGVAIGATSIPVASAAQVVTAGKHIRVAGDTTGTYRVSTGLGTGAGNIVIDAPGLRQAIPASATSVSVDMVDDQVLVQHPGSNNIGLTAYRLNGAHAAGTTSLSVGKGIGTVLAGECIQLKHAIGTNPDSGRPYYDNAYYKVTTSLTSGVIVIEAPGLNYAMADDTVVVNRGHCVTIDGAYTFGNDTSSTTAANNGIVVSGTLKGSRSTSWRLTCRGSCILAAYGTFDFGYYGDVLQSGVTGQIVPNDSAAPNIGKHGLLSYIGNNTHSWKMRGPAKTRNTELTAAVSASGTGLQVQSADGWEIGDRIAIAPNDDSTTVADAQVVTLQSGSGLSWVVTPGVTVARAAGTLVGNLSSRLSVVFPSAAASSFVGFGNIGTTGFEEFDVADVRVENSGTSAGWAQQNLPVFQGVGVSPGGTSFRAVARRLALEGTTASGSALLGDSVSAFPGGFSDCAVHTLNGGMYVAQGSPAQFDGCILYRCGGIAASSAFGAGGYGAELNSCEAWSTGASFLTSAGNFLVNGGAYRSATQTVSPAVGNAKLNGVDIRPADRLVAWNANAQTAPEFVQCQLAGGALTTSITVGSVPSQSAVSNLTAVNGDTSDNRVLSYYQTTVTDTTICKRSTYAVKIQPKVANTAITYVFTLPVVSGVAQTLKGSLRFDSTYGTATPPSIALSGQGVTESHTCAATADAWDDFEFTFTPTSTGDITATVTVQSTSTSGFAWLDGVYHYPMTQSVRHYGYQWLPQAAQVVDSRITLTEAAALALPIVVEHGAETITITGSATAREVFEHCIADLCQTANQGEAVHISSATGETFETTYTVVGDVVGVYTDTTGTSASLTLAGLQDASVLLVDGSGATVEFQAAQSGEFDYVYNFAPGATGTWRWVAKAPGREHATGTFTPGAGGAFSYAPVLTQKLTPSGDPMYTGTTSALVSVSIPGTTTAYIDIGDGTAPLQESFNETELALVTQAGLEWLAAGKDDVSVFDSGSGDYLFLTAGWRLRRASAGDANAAIEAYVTSADGGIVDDTNGPVLYLTSNTPAAIAAAVWAYIDRELTQAIPTAAQIADTMLGRNLAGGSDGGRTVRDALRASRNKSAISGSTLTIYQEDDATPAWTAAVSTAERDALQSIDPA